MVKKSSKKHPSKASTSRKTSAKAPAQPQPVPAPAARSHQDIKGQQRLLDIFHDAFNPVLTSEVFPTLLQEVKQALYNRDFAAAFGREDYLEAYAARWSPTRALCYAAIYLDIKNYLTEIIAQNNGRAEFPKEVATLDAERSEAASTEQVAGAQEPSNATHARLKMLAIGGCAAEHLAFAHCLKETASHGDLILIDSAPWSSITTLLQQHITSPPTLSKYASAALKTANEALIAPSQLCVNFAQKDVLSLDEEKLMSFVGTEPLIVTLMFTLNELYTCGGIGKTTKLLKNLAKVMPERSLLLVVDSPGSYSEAPVGKEKRRYPMQWLLDHTLLEVNTQGASWEKLESHDSVWFRLPEELHYSIPLENMRYQMHLYSLIKGVSAEGTSQVQ